jgi:transcriptional regulator with XRE-family HTH domain
MRLTHDSVYYGNMPTQQRPPGPYTKHVAATVRDLRQRAGLTTAQLARLLTETGRPTHQTTATRLESGDRAITVDDLEALARVFGIRPAALLPTPITTDPCARDQHAYDSREISGPGPRVCNDCGAIEGE